MKKKEDKLDVMKKPKITTIKLSTKTKSRLNNLKIHKRETYEEILQKMLGILNTCLLNPEKARGFFVGRLHMVGKGALDEWRVQPSTSGTLPV